MSPSIPVPNDPLGEALHLLRMTGAFYCRSEFSAPWGLDLPAMDQCLMFHVVTAGHCWLEVPEEEPVSLTPGDLALIPHGLGHQLVSERGEPTTPLFDLPRVEMTESYEHLQMGGGGSETLMVCGAVRFAHPAASQFLAALPRLLHVEAWGTTENDWLLHTLRFMASEAREMRPGGVAILTRLCDVLIIQAIRTWLDRDPAARVGWLGALRDESIGRALAEVHRDPSQSWTVARMAEEASMSRSAFSARFVEILGEPPMHYVTRWRMNVATELLIEEQVTIAELAARLGYQSEASFSRAFKRSTGSSPGAVRRAGGRLGEPVSA